MRFRRSWLIIGLLTAGRTVGVAQTMNATRTRARPNIILILTDDLDQNLGSMDRLPRLKQMLAGQGMSFPNSFVSESLCCPSRVSIQRGQYVHNHQVFGNHPPTGGFPRFHALKEDTSTIGTWMKAAGYRTGFFGKYLNNYPMGARRNYVPPGWDEWMSPLGNDAYGEFSYTLNEGGNLVPFGKRPQDYFTDVLSDRATRFMQKAAAERVPYFLFVSTFAPHQPATPAPRHATAFSSVTAPRLPSYNERDVTDKPKWVQDRPILPLGREVLMDSLYRLRLRSMLAVQDLVGRVLLTLKNTGEAGNTYVFFTSDNGFHLGEHRLTAGKLTPYEEDTRVPLYVRGPGIPAGSQRPEIVGNVDLAPTIAEVAGARVPAFVDGRSFAQLLTGANHSGRWRGAFLIEQKEALAGGAPVSIGPTGGEPQDQQEKDLPPGKPFIPAYDAIRTSKYDYVVYVTGERELYDLATDPYELNNIVRSAPKSLENQLDGWLKRLMKCRGVTCRVADVAPPH